MCYSDAFESYLRRAYMEFNQTIVRYFSAYTVFFES